MKKKLITLLIFLLTIVPLFTQEDVKIKEEVTVFNVKVLVRVLHRKKPVDGLTKEDFRIYEGNKLQKINAFYKIKKKIRIPKPRPSIRIDRPSPQLAPPRYFVLVFRLTDFNKQVEKGLNYVFDNIIKENDQLLVFANEKTLFINNLGNKKKIQSSVTQIIKEQSHEARMQKEINILKIKGFVERTKQEQAFSKGKQLFFNFLRDYLSLWREYKHRYLVPDMDKYFNFSSHLEKIQKEKWVISFYQIETFPKLKALGELRRTIDQEIEAMQAGRSEDIVLSRKMQNLSQTIDFEMNAAQDFPSEEISKLFYKVGATFHSILIPVLRAGFYEELELTNLSTDIENSLREITKRTGGKLIYTGNLESALDSIIEVEDISYMLTYAPEHPKKIGKIKVEVSNSKYNVLYDKDMRADYLTEYIKRKRKKDPSVALENITFKEKKLSMIIKNFKMKKNKGSDVGELCVSIQVKNDLNEILYKKENNIEAKKKSVTISLGFPGLNAGIYFISVNVKDLSTGKTCMEFLQPEIY